MWVLEELFTGRDGVVRAAKLRAGRGFMERPIQHLYGKVADESQGG